jgi:rare lipoprotein A
LAYCRLHSRNGAANCCLDGRCKGAPNVLAVGDAVRLTVRYRMKSANNRMEHSRVSGGSHRGPDGFWVDAMARLIMNGLILTLASVIFQPACAGNGNTGMASFYRGVRSSSGEFTAAHRSLRIGTRVRVVSVGSGRSVVVRINDRGPFIVGRIIDLSRAAAARLNMLSAGVTRVRLEILGGSTKKTQLLSQKTMGRAVGGRQSPKRHPNRTVHRLIELHGV